MAEVNVTDTNATVMTAAERASVGENKYRVISNQLQDYSNIFSEHKTFSENPKPTVGIDDGDRSKQLNNPYIEISADSSFRQLFEQNNALLGGKPTTSKFLSLNDEMVDYAKQIYHSVNMFSKSELDIFNQTYRFGYFNYHTLTAGREFLFFTKPDLNIAERGSFLNLFGNMRLQEYFKGIPFWNNLIEDRPEIIASLQSSVGNTGDPFCHLLQNQCISSLDIPSLSAQMTDGPVNDYGVGYSYRGSSEASDDNPEFSLEFKDNRILDVYLFFKAYELYETMKHHGSVAPDQYYIENRIIHDQFSIYKIIVGEDLETIVYWGKMYGVTPKSLPRDAFSNANFDNGLSYNVDFQAAFYEDMIPDILADFNALSHDAYFACPYQVDITNGTLGGIDGRAVRAAYIYEGTDMGKKAYKLRWRGVDRV